mgnify:CR=1 FL=1
MPTAARIVRVVRTEPTDADRLRRLCGRRREAACAEQGEDQIVAVGRQHVLALAEQVPGHQRQDDGAVVVRGLGLEREHERAAQGAAAQDGRTFTVTQTASVKRRQIPPDGYAGFRKVMEASRAWSETTFRFTGEGK